MGIHLLQREADQPPRTADLLAMIKRNVELEARLIDELLDVTRITQDKLKVDPRPLDLHDTIRLAAASQVDALALRKQDLSLRLEAEATQVLGDPDRLQQALWNLIQNASKFSADGESIILSTSNAVGRIAVRVTDAGVGLAPEDLETIFEPFVQASDAGTHRGLGLGLTITRSIIEAHGGRLEAESPGKGRGATFTLTLPLAGDPPP
jgi:signal transduction histidine kinase